MAINENSLLTYCGMGLQQGLDDSGELLGSPRSEGNELRCCRLPWSEAVGTQPGQTRRPPLPIPRDRQGWWQLPSPFLESTECWAEPSCRRLRTHFSACLGDKEGRECPSSGSSRALGSRWLLRNGSWSSRELHLVTLSREPSSALQSYYGEHEWCSTADLFLDICKCCDLSLRSLPAPATTKSSRNHYREGSRGTVVLPLLQHL